MIWLFSMLIYVSCAEKSRVEGTEAGDCSDDADNDADGLFDCNDDGCKGSQACSENTDSGDHESTDNEPTAEPENEPENEPDVEPSNEADNQPDNEPVPIGSSRENPAISCLEIVNTGATEGDGLYWIAPTELAPIQAFCDMTTGEGGWTVIQAYDISNREEHRRKPLFGEANPRSADTPNWEDYRMEQGYITALYDSGSARFHTRCHRNFTDSMDDYLFGDIALVVEEFEELSTNSNSANPYNIAGKIRGHRSANLNWFWSNRGQLNASPHISTDMSNVPGSNNGEEGFNWDSGELNPSHLCHHSLGEIIWMLR